MLVSESQAWQFRDYFVALAGIYPRFDELLQRWEASPSLVAWGLLSDEVFEHSRVIFQNKYFNGPFLASVPLSQRFRAWVTSQGVRDKLLVSFSQYSDEAAAEKLGVAYDLIEYELKYPG